MYEIVHNVSLAVVREHQHSMNKHTAMRMRHLCQVVTLHRSIGRRFSRWSPPVRAVPAKPNSRWRRPGVVPRPGKQAIDVAVVNEALVNDADLLAGVHLAVCVAAAGGCEHTGEARQTGDEPQLTPQHPVS